MLEKNVSMVSKSDTNMHFAMLTLVKVEMILPML